MSKAKKAAYAKAQGQTRDHHCHWQGAQSKWHQPCGEAEGAAAWASCPEWDVLVLDYRGEP